jgi:glycerophosphoryl diester phosphodiesterase
MVLPSSGAVQQRLPSLLERPIAFAHRGARAHARENTIDAFTLGLRLGASGLESDVWLTADGVPVLDHDGVVKLGRRKRTIGTLPRADLPEHVPTLHDLLARCPGDHHLALDLKGLDAGPAVIDLVRREAPGGLSRLWLCHPDPVVLRELRQYDETVRLVNSTRVNRMKEGPERRAANLAADGIDAVNLHHTEWSGGLTTLFHRFQRICFGWDLQFEHVMRPVLRMGIDGIFSDHVDVMVDAFNAELGRVP